MKGYFHINPFISISLAITLFSFVGVPPIVGFFAKQIFFYPESYKINLSLDNLNLVGYIVPNNSVENISINSSLSTSISILTLLLVLFIYTPGEWFNIVSILSVIILEQDA